ncbi:hemagglutinin repeat-containing protein [Xanthomonas oryzae]|uniref:hemagglutinin repeat-containing protein n=1 Tax=Xanthomonas oryzae TaxID=347 RepID=UPI002116D2D6|nr:hemagglutinin repeat-containing protein [Xanthomonas oryzae]
MGAAQQHDTTLKGAVLSANTVLADIGGDLNIESQQDTSTYTVAPAKPRDPA